jgi:23S rRNA pseudouridine2605 synthase
MMAEGERLQKIIAGAGLASRRKAEELILQGRVSINGKKVTELGTRADPENDHIKVDGKLVHAVRRRIYILLNKPKQVVSTLSDPQGRVKVIDLVKVKERIYPVGRLDYETEGLILLTNDGNFAKIASRAGEALPKHYEVKVRSSPEEDVLKRLRDGIRLKDGTKLARCRIIPVKQGNNSWFEVILTQGRNREIREMFTAVGHPVMKLRRTRIGFLTDKGIAPGEYRFLTEAEVARILRSGAGQGTGKQSRTSN